MLSEVIVGSVRDTPELTPAEGEEVLKVCGRLAVEAELFLVVVTETEILGLEVERKELIAAEGPHVDETPGAGVGLGGEIQGNTRQRSYANAEA